MKKHILVLGAGLMQKPAIESAHGLDCRVTVVDGNPGALCRPMSDFFEQIDLKDTDAICSFARCLYDNEGLDAIFTAGTDFSYAVARAAEVCGLPGHSGEAAKNASDKLLMRARFEKNGVPSPRFAHADLSATRLPEKDLEKILDDCALSFPLVVKPCDNMGARGCRLVRSVRELSSALADAVFYSKTNRAIIEEYMDGPEFSIDALVFNGQLTVTGCADRHIYFPPYFIETGHTIPSSVNEEARRVLLKTFAQGVHALGLSCGAAKADIKLTKNGPMVGEIAARLSGGYMSGWTYPYASDINLTREALLIALGKEPSNLIRKRVKLDIADTPLEIFDLPCVRHCAERAWVSVPGKISETLFFDKAQKLSGVRKFFPRALKNDKVVFPVNNVEKAGNAIAVGDSYGEASEKAISAVKTVFLRLHTDNSATKNFLEESLDTAFPPSAFELPAHVRAEFETLEDFPQSDEAELTLLPILKDCAALTDWNGRSLAETVELYNRIMMGRDKSQNKDVCGIHGKEFWHCLIRGGLQGAVFYSDMKNGETE